MVLFIAAAISSAISQDINLECIYELDFFEDYVCVLRGVEVLDESQNVIVSGTHLPGLSNADVRIVSIQNSNTPFIIQQLFTVFTNLTELDIDASNLEAINLPNPTNLIAITLYLNNISRIDNGTFLNQPQLRFIWAINCQIATVEENAFEGLGQLSILVLINNRISDLAPSLLHPLTSARVIDFERNLLTRIEETTFVANSNLGSLFLEHNQITEVSPRFHHNLTNINFINFIGNQCASQSFWVNVEAGRIAMNNALRPCFNNFNGVSPDDARNITLTFTGRMVISDDVGNVIVRV